MKCSICGADGTNKTTCPFNPESTNTKPEKHNSAPLSAGDDTDVKTKTKTKPKPVFKADPAPVSKTDPKPAPKAKPVLKAGPKPAHPEAPVFKDPKRQEEYEADLVGLMMPHVPVKLRAVNEELTDRCQQCLRYIKNRNNPLNKITELQAWQHINVLCSGCVRLIDEQIAQDQLDNRARYKAHHKGKAITLSELTEHGPKEDYFNATMREGAQFWAQTAVPRMLSKAPKPPTGK